MVYDPITSWQIEKEKVKAATDFLFLGSKINADSDCSYENKRHLLLGRKGVTKLDSVLKSRHYIADKGPYSQVACLLLLAVVMYGSESWTITKAEC